MQSSDRSDTALQMPDVINSMQNVMATSHRDWGMNREDAWLYGIVLGWDFDEEPDEESAMPQLAAQHGWDDETVARLRSLHAAFTSAEAQR